MKNKIGIVLFAIILVHIMFILLSAGQLYYGDEVFFVEAAREIASGQVTGHFGYLDGKSNDDKSLMLMHPPTYAYLLALFIFLFGESTYSIRAVSSLFAVGVIILIYLITKKILKEKGVDKAERWALFAAFLYAISPIAIQNSILVDIDGGLLNFFALLFLYLYISEKRFVYLVPSLFMVFASKMLAPIVLLVSLLLANLGAKKYKETFRVIKLYVIAGGSFFLIFFIYTKIFNLDWGILFSHNSIFAVLKIWATSTYIVLARSLWGFKIFFYFATPFLILMFTMASYKILKNSIKYRTDYIQQHRNLILLLVYALTTLLVVFMSGLSGWNFAKYHIAAIPPAIILIVYFTPKEITDTKKMLPLVFLTILILLSYFVFFLGDPLIPELEGKAATTGFFEVAKVVLIRFFMYAIVPIILCVGLIKKIPTKKIWFALLFLVIFTSLYLDVIQAKADYSTHTLYGDRGLKEVLNFVSNKSPEQILTYNHVAYYLGYNRTYELISLYNNKQKLKEVIDEKDINWIILYQKDITFIGKDILKDFELEKEIGSYKILKRKQ